MCLTWQSRPHDLMEGQGQGHGSIIRIRCVSPVSRSEAPLYRMLQNTDIREIESADRRRHCTECSRIQISGRLRVCLHYIRGSFDAGLFKSHRMYIRLYRIAQYLKYKLMTRSRTQISRKLRVCMHYIGAHSMRVCLNHTVCALNSIV